MAELLPRIVDELNRSHNQANSTPNSNQLQNFPKFITVHTIWPPHTIHEQGTMNQGDPFLKSLIKSI